jgi:hypothetical protein
MGGGISLSSFSSLSSLEFDILYDESILESIGIDKEKQKIIRQKLEEKEGKRWKEMKELKDKEEIDLYLLQYLEIFDINLRHILSSKIWELHIKYKEKEKEQDREKETRPIFPKDGVSLRGFDDFISHCGGRERLVGLTTTEVCENYLKQMNLSQSYCNYLKD